ncbi:MULTISPECIES: DMT family transporter [Brevibacillus]|uniref:DMT family transporter n=1 Tax=Brevibacillus TaxID=55080 RepID=UPI000D0E706F|nr:MULTISPECIES: DMT family transporter [Brevibacillus]MED1946734.1 DMT family transporter [Brevibacillus formosus]MED1996992.1 DMT family transporter [Brevibacillus formosus]MED2084909.1 DMT family transporter [Brevibacillus formosus]PSK20277.1 EamA family transporter [Brevibacillus sp. NRRL NRS-603]
MKDQQKAILAALLNAGITGLSFLFLKMALAVTNPVDTLAHRFTVAFIAASIPIVFGWIKLSIKPKEILTIIPLAMLYPILFFTLQAFGLVYTTSSEAGIIQATVPIFTMIMAAFFLGESSTWLQKLSTLLSVGGVVYIFAMKGLGVSAVSGSSIGTILILLSAFSLAGYSVLARKMTKSFHYIDMTYMVALLGFVFFNGWSVIRHSAEGTLSTYFAPFASSAFIISIVFLGILSSLMTSFMTNFALSKMEASKLSVFNNLSTLVTIVAGVIFLQEQLAYYHLIGAVMIIIGVIGTNFLGAKFKKQNHTPQPKSTSV